MSEQESPPPDGVVAMIVGPDGHVWATAADFDRSGYGGFSLHEAQRLRARAAVRWAFVRNVCNAHIASALTEYTVERLVDDVCRRLGYVERFVLLGHAEIGAAEASDFLRPGDKRLA